ncbi:MAG TPA: Arm DNA-binding domain-containing protein [Desulfuromonadaceae bacterium]
MKAFSFCVVCGGGLFLLITPTGGKLWRLKYRFGGTENQTSLTDARHRLAGFKYPVSRP